MSLATRIAQEFNSVRSEAAAQALLENKLAVSASGYTTKVNQEDRWLETNTPNVIVDKVGDDYVIDGVVYSQLGEELVSQNTTSYSVLNTTTYTNNGFTIKMVDDGVLTARSIAAVSTTIGSYYKLDIPVAYSSRSNTVAFVSNNADGSSGHTVEATGKSHTISFKATASTSYVGVTTEVPTVGTEIIHSAFSVKELKQATLPLAPFASGSTDELLDDKTYGLTTQVSHSKGDIVVTGNELVTGDSSTFDTSIGDWISVSPGSVTFEVGGYAKFDRNDGGSIVGYLANKVIPNKAYTITFDVIAYSSSSHTMQILNCPLQFYSTGTHTVTGIASNSSIEVKISGSTSAWYIIDNISVRLADTTYQAITSTTAGALLTDTSKFKVISDVTRHDMVTLNASGYKTFKGLYFYQDDTLSYDKIASDRGWSKLGNNTYIDEDGIKCAIVGVVPRLNAGAFHPAYNFYGTRYYNNTTELNDASFWYESVSGDINNTYIAFKQVPRTTNETGLYDSLTSISRPDSRTSDKIYNGGEGGLGQLGYCYAIDKIDLDIESDVINSFSGFESGVIMKDSLISTDTSLRAYGYWTNSFPWFSGVGKINASAGDYAYIYLDGVFTAKCIIVEANKPYLTTYYHTVSVINGSLLTNTTALEIKVVTYGKSKSHLTKGTALTIDAIGNPTNYPSFLKNTLASGKSLHINPLLVGQDGTSYVDNGVLSVIKSNKAITAYTLPYVALPSSEPYTWLTLSESNNAISNTRDINTANLVICPYTSANKPAVQSTPKQVVKVLPKVVASNSHSKYKGAMVTNVVTGKVAVGNGTNGLESKVLENINAPQKYDYIIKTDNDIVPFINGITFFSTINVTGASRPVAGIGYVVKNGTGGNFAIKDFNTLNLDVITLVPSHQPITLDNQNSPASKWFTALSLDGNEYCLDIYAKGLAYNSGTTSYDGDNELFDQLTNGVKTDLNGNIVNTKVLTRRLGVFKK